MQIVSSLPADVFVVDGLPPEVGAMLLAMYSRDPRSARVHLEKIKEVGVEKFMGTYYVGYGHKSIGDCGSTTVCAELVSMLAAKAIQHHPLYNGQEASTRYLDMTNQPILNPFGNELGALIQTRWMNIYSRVLEALIPHFTEKYPMLPQDNPVQYAKAIKAKAFDVARAFLPAGCTTYVGWHTNLRQAWDHIYEMRFHPLDEVQEIAAAMLARLKESYPNSFGFKDRPEQDDYYSECSSFVYSSVHTLPREGWSYTSSLNTFQLKDHPLLTSRPKWAELPDHFNRFGEIRFNFFLDFGSFRDIQRHRSCVQVMPLLTTRYGIEEWYLESLPEELRNEILPLVEEQEEAIHSLTDDTILAQYYVAMGYRVKCELIAHLPSAVYIAELRSTQAVHPTLRVIAQKMGKALKEVLPSMTLYVDKSPDEWSTLRGKHDIVKKEE